MNVLVVSGGPSVKESLKKIQVNQFDLVCCVKGSIDLVTKCDLHFVNSVNARKYTYKKKPLVVKLTDKNMYKEFQDFDIEILADRNKINIFNSKKIESFFRKKEKLNPDSGIVFSLVIPFILQYKPSFIHVLGIDYDNPIYVHAYNSRKVVTGLNFITRLIKTYKVFRYIIYMKNFLYHHLYLTYNHGELNIDEKNKIIDGLTNLKKELSEHSIHLKVEGNIMNESK
ncbi:hypothetical protein N8835_03155 [Alphaproteobacteria bacterium]|nr:hypothetical protein [Alphaproteobacteria bacterium]